MRRALLEGAFAPGEALSEINLAAQLKVSRGPVREALLVLSQEGLVTYTQNRGFSVLRFTSKDLDQIAQAREPMEVLALRLARERVSTQDLRLLEHVKNRILKAMSNGQFRESVRADLEFHSLIAHKSGNPWLEEALKRILVPYFTFTMVFWRKPEQLTVQSLAEEHEAFCDYLRGNTLKSTQRLIHMHFKNKFREDHSGRVLNQPEALQSVGEQ